MDLQEHITKLMLSFTISISFTKSRGHSNAQESDTQLYAEHI
jgi:hypothetical protein